MKKQYEAVCKVFVCRGCDIWGMPDVSVERLTRKKGGFEVSGRVGTSICPRCGDVVREVAHVVPIEVKDLVCECSSTEFTFAIRSILPKKVKHSEPSVWEFEMDINCASCNKKRLAERLLEFLKLKKIKVGASGVSVEMK